MKRLIIFHVHLFLQKQKTNEKKSMLAPSTLPLDKIIVQTTKSNKLKKKKTWKKIQFIIFFFLYFEWFNYFFTVFSIWQNNWIFFLCIPFELNIMAFLNWVSQHTNLNCHNYAYKSMSYVYCVRRWRAVNWNYKMNENENEQKKKLLVIVINKDNNS